MDGIDYYGVEFLNIDTGSGADIFNVQGTTQGSERLRAPGAHDETSRLNDGNDKVFVSSNADLDGLLAERRLPDRQPRRRPRRAEHRPRRRPARLFMSDEGSSHPDLYTITGTRRRRDRDSTAHRSRPGSTRRSACRISYTIRAATSTTASPTGRARQRHGLSRRSRAGAGAADDDVLNTGLGNDNVTATLPTAATGSSSLEHLRRLGDRRPGRALRRRLRHDNDTVNALGSALPLVIIGGFGNDTIRGGSATTSSSATSAAFSTRTRRTRAARAVRLRRPRRPDHRSDQDRRLRAGCTPSCAPT